MANQAVSRFLSSLEGRRTALVLGGLELFVLSAVNRLDFPLSVPFLVRVTGQPYLDMCAFCSSSAVLTQLDALGDRGRLLQALLIPTIDVLIPVLSFLFGLSALLTLAAPWRSHRWVGGLLWLPAAALALDLAENASIIALLLRYPLASPEIAGLQGILTGLKFVAYGSVLMAVLALLVVRGGRALRPRQP